MILSGKGLDRTWQDDLHRFYTLLIPEAVRPKLKQAKEVVIVPHHVLHYFPFAALVTERDTKERGKLEMVSPKFLVDETFDILYAPSLGVWDKLSLSDSTRRIANAIGIVEVPGAPALPGVARDLQNFRDVFGDGVKTVVEGNDATTRRVKTVLAEKGILLIATHGMNEAEHPLDSYLLFIPAEEDQGGFAEGNLRARHILTTPVNASMVVMSACFSGLGDRTPPAGDDLFGLQRAFLMKGVRTVVSGLWDVYDGTAPELIRGYFERIHKGLPASKALAESQRAFLNKLRATGKSELYLHPYFWGVYTVAGNDGATGSP
jgi:CHAT domain-containing protein